jgi:hypothetical protein
MNIKFSNNKTALFAMIISMALYLGSCKDKNPKPDNPPENETELITTVILALRDSTTSGISYCIFRDADGPGGNPPSRFDTVKLSANHTYFTQISLLDESKTPTDTVSNEVREEADDHLFVFTPDGVNIGVSITDKDDHQLPVGLLSTWRTGAASSGKIHVVLRHQPGVKDGTAGPGETDVDVNFNCILQ